MWDLLRRARPPLPCGASSSCSKPRAEPPQPPCFVAPCKSCFQASTRQRQSSQTQGHPLCTPKLGCSSVSPHVGVHQQVRPLHGRFLASGGPGFAAAAACGQLRHHHLQKQLRVMLGSGGDTHHSSPPRGGTGGSWGRTDQACSSLSRFSSWMWMRTLRLFTTSRSCTRISCSAARSSGVFRDSSLFM